MIEMFKDSKFAPTAGISGMLQEIEVKKKNAGKKYDEKAMKKEIVDGYKKILAEARKKFALGSPPAELKLKIREWEAGKSTRVSQRNLVLPLNNVFDYNNYLVGVEYDARQFKFVMSSGEKNDIHWCGNAGALIKVNPPDSVITRIQVDYHKGCITRGLKLFTKDGTCVLQVGIFGNETTELINYIHC